MDSKNVYSCSDLSLFQIPKIFQEAKADDCIKFLEEDSLMQKQQTYLKNNLALFSCKEFIDAASSLCSFWSSPKTRKDKKHCRQFFDLFPKKLHFVKSDIHFISLFLVLLVFSGLIKNKTHLLT